MVTKKVQKPNQSSIALDKIGLILTILVMIVQCGPVLDNNQIVFQMSGTTSYMPDSGGTNRQGYSLKIGYSGHSWLAVQFVTGNNKNDVLLLQQDDFYTDGTTPTRIGHQLTVTDFYRSGNDLNYDQITQYDISSFGYSQTRTYSLDITRFLGSNSGQDWNAAANGYQLIQICFYSSSVLFGLSTWTSGVSQCYFFEIDNYVSEFKGVKLKNFNLNGYTTGIYGWIDGPYVSDNIYIYHKVPLFTYNKQPAIIIEMGTTNADAGQDFHVYSPTLLQTGDYFGASTTQLVKDNTKTSGFENGGLSLKRWNAVPSQTISSITFTALRISFKRDINTYDVYDKQMKSTFIFCVYLYTVGTINSDLTDKVCDIVELAYHYPRMQMPIKLLQKITQILTTTLLIVLLIFYL